MAKKFIPPTLQDVEEFVRKEGLHFSPVDFIKHYEDAEPKWTYYDRNNKQKPVRNWKQKARNVWEKIALKEPKKCYCGRPGVYYVNTDITGMPYYRCVDHKPIPKPILTKEQSEQVLKVVEPEKRVDKGMIVNKMIKDLFR